MKKQPVAKPQAASPFHLCHLCHLWLLLVVGLVSIATAAGPTTQPTAPYIVLDTIAAPAAPVTQPSAPQQRALAALHEKLAGLLTPADELQSSLTWNLQTATALRALSDDAQALLESRAPAAARFAAAQVKLRIAHALLLEAMAEHASVQVSFRLLALRHAAERMRDIALPAARTQADSWTLMADLVDVQRNITDPSTRQMQAAKRLEQFVQAHRATHAGGNPPAVQQARLMLVMLDDQLGRTAAAKKLLPQAQRAATAADNATRARLRTIAQTCGMLGRTIALTAQTAGGLWSTAAHRGDIVVIHFFDARHPLPGALPGAGVWKAMDKTHAAASGKGLRLLSVAVGGPVGKEMVNAHPWPMVVEPAQARHLAQQLAVASLPRLVVLDRQGRFAASGSSPAVLDEARALLHIQNDPAAATQPR